MSERAWPELIAQIRSRQPVIHCITNYVTANDVANIILASGASPVMADGVREAEDISDISHGLVLNLGTMRENAIESMLRAGHRAAKLGHPVVLDPVGAGASAFRKETALRILKEVPCSLIRGNASEIRALVNEHVMTRGVDTDSREALTADNRQETAAMARQLSKSTGAVVVMTGATDLVAWGSHICFIKNGHPMMSRITGAGCMLDGVLASALAAADMDFKPGSGAAGKAQSSCTPLGEEHFLHAAYTVAAVGICGELAFEKTEKSGGGTGSFRMYFIDAMSKLSDEEIRDRIQIEWDTQMSERGKSSEF